MKNGLFWSRYSFVIHSIDRKLRDWGLARWALFFTRHLGRRAVRQRGYGLRLLIFKMANNKVDLGQITNRHAIRDSASPNPKMHQGLRTIEIEMYCGFKYNKTAGIWSLTLVRLVNFSFGNEKATTKAHFRTFSRNTCVPERKKNELAILGHLSQRKFCSWDQLYTMVFIILQIRWPICY